MRTRWRRSRDGNRARARASALVLGPLLVAVVAALIPAAGRVGADEVKGATTESGSAGSAEAEASASASLHFVRGGETRRVLSLEALRQACPSVEVEVDDPYHRRRMRYVGLPLRCVLDRGFVDSGGASSLADESVLLRALDGYTRPVPGSALLEPGGVLAYGEPALMGTADASSAAVPRFSPIDRRHVDPAPFYLVWTNEGQDDPHDSPWPYQLTRIEVASFRKAFPHTVPSGLREDHPGWSGYAIFRRSCASCHSINGEGGKIGPDLNVPRSIVEYRPEDQIRRYVRDPESFRYTSMPAHPGLDEDDLDALIAYFRAMSERKHDPRTRGGS